MAGRQQVGRHHDAAAGRSGLGDHVADRATGATQMTDPYFTAEPHRQPRSRPVDAPMRPHVGRPGDAEHHCISAAESGCPEPVEQAAE
jgi:hypothetical protein